MPTCSSDLSTSHGSSRSFKFKSFLLDKEKKEAYPVENIFDACLPLLREIFGASPDMLGLGANVYKYKVATNDNSYTCIYDRN